MPNKPNSTSTSQSYQSKLQGSLVKKDKPAKPDVRPSTQSTPTNGTK